MLRVLVTGGFLIVAAIILGLPDFTEGLLLNIGTRSRRLLNNDSAAVATMPGLMNGLENLTSLIRFRDPSVENQERRHFGGSGGFMPRAVLDARAGDGSHEGRSDAGDQG